MCDLLTKGKGAHVPEKSLLMMHAGIGIGFAKHVITKMIRGALNRTWMRPSTNS